MTEFGYAGEILKIDLTRQTTSILATADYADRFLGGRGIAAKLYWDEVSPETRAFDPDNCLICMTGPLAGFTRFAGCRWQICGKSPLMDPESFSYANLGGSWGAWLKYAGYDGLIITGKADRPVYILLTDGDIEIRNATHLWGRTTIETQDMLQAELGRGARVLGIGPAAENRVPFATVLASGNASGSSGFGSVMGSKMLKAVVVKAEEKIRPKAADPDRLKALAGQVYQLRTENYENYLHVVLGKTRLTACYGCISGCDRREYKAEDGKAYKYFCQSSSVYLGPAMKYNQNTAGEEVNMLAGRLCDQYGLDTAVLSPMIGWLGQCYEAGILDDKETGLPLSRIGSAEFIHTLVTKLSYRQDFGDILSHGISRAAEQVGKDSRKFLSTWISTPSNETQDYDPRFMLANALIYATKPRRPIQMLHATSLPIIRWVNWVDGWKDAFLSTEILQDIAMQFWGSADAGDFSTDEGKAFAAKRIQDFGYIKESLILCDLAWPIYQVRHFDNDIGFATLESRIISAVTGRDFHEEELIKTGERIFNLQRAILVRQGWGGRAGDTLLDYFFHEPLRKLFFDPECIAPGKDGKQISKKGAVMEKEGFERLKDEYYTLRGWDVGTGFQTRKKLDDLNLNDIASDLGKRGLLR
jgi:aldehyde:ferredoxin oxidoreductase